MGDLAFTDVKQIPFNYKINYAKINVCYIILTCEKYLPTRVSWQKKTCFKDVNPKDCYFISSKKKEPNIYGWNTEDDYSSCIIKYIKFFQNMKLKYDWYMFIDDDTYVFPNRVEQYLARFDKTQPLYIGAMWSHLDDLRFMSGGAGFFLTNKTYIMLVNHLKNNDNTHIRQPGADVYGDATLGLWIREINRKHNYKIKLLSDWTNLNIGHHNSLYHILKAVTLHQVNKEELFDLYDKYKYVVTPSIGLPRKLIGIPNNGTHIVICQKDENKCLRHYNYKIMVSTKEEGNADMTFLLIRCGKNYRLESLNYKTHFIAPRCNDGLFIMNGLPNEKDNVWEIQNDNNEYRFKSKSEDPRWSNKFIRVTDDGVLLDKEPTTFNIYKAPLP